MLGTGSRFLSAVVLFLVSWGLVAVTGQTVQAKQDAPAARVIHARKHDTSSAPVRESRAKLQKLRKFEEIPLFSLPAQEPGAGAEPAPAADANASAVSPDRILTPSGAPQMLMPDPLVNFAGIHNIAGVAPPDTCGDVGPDHYVQAVNLHFQVFDKTGTSLLGPLPLNSIWSGFGGVCETLNNGDPIVLYDQWADRWLISQFALNYGGEGFHQCIAVSTTGDPTGTWHRYDYFMSDTLMNDYPKFGVWPDGYYMSINQFNAATAYSFAGQGVAAFERDKMLAGQAAAMQYINASATHLRAPGHAAFGCGRSGPAVRRRAQSFCQDGRQ